MGTPQMTGASSLLPIRVIRTREETEALCEELLEYKDIVSYDTEWYDYDDKFHVVDNALVFCATFSWRRKDGMLERVYVHNYGEQSGLIHALEPFFESEKHLKTGHNIPVDFHSVKNHSINVRGAVYDTMVMDWMIDETRGPGEPYWGNGHDLKSCAQDFLGRPYREDYRHTFGMPKLKRDGTPYAQEKLDVPSLPEYISLPSPITGELVTNPPTYEEAAAGAEEERSFLEQKLGRELTILEARHAGPFSRWLVLLEYAVADAWDGYELLEGHRNTLSGIEWAPGKSYWDYYVQTETKITGIIQKMERRGMYLDTDQMLEMEEKATRELDALESKIIEWAGVPLKISSDKQLRMLLHGDGMQPVMWKTSKKKVDYYIQGLGLPVLAVTEKEQHPKVGGDDLKKLRKHLDKIGYEGDLSGLDALVKHSKTQWHRDNMRKIRLLAERSNRRIRCRINQIGTTSGRFSTANPVNLQNVPTGDKDLYHLRDCFCAPPGHLLIVADFSQLEYRLLAHFSQEPKLIKLFFEGWDLHSLTTYNIFPHVKKEVDERFGEFTIEASKWIQEAYPDERKKAKTLNFEIIYGVGYKKLAEQLNISEDDGKRMIDGWFAGYPYVKAWMNRELANARRLGYGRTLAGRFRHPGKERFFSTDKRTRGEEERSFLNALIQGSAADMAKKAMILIDEHPRLIEMGCHTTMQIHDEIIIECPKQHVVEAAAIIKKLMEQPFSRPLRVPMPVAVGHGPSWETAKV